MESLNLNQFVKEKRKSSRLTQEELSNKAGVGLRFVRELERGKPTLKLDKVNQVLKLFGYELGLIQIDKKLTYHIYLSLYQDFQMYYLYH